MIKNKSITVIMMALLILSFSSSLVYAQYGQKPKMTEKTTGTKIMMKAKGSLDMTMRRLWEDHIMWTRHYIISVVDKLSDVDEVAARLMKNQDDLGNAIKPYYGEEAGNKLTALLKTHIMQAGELVKAAMANNKTAVSMAEKKWSANADEMATFLSDANPNWTKASLTNMLDTHLKLTEEEAVARINKDYKTDIATFDQIQVNALDMADALTRGIMVQFPNKFLQMTDVEKK